MRSKVSALGAEVRAVEEGLHARLAPDGGSFLVRCRHPKDCGTPSHRITLEGLCYADGSIAIRFRCDCPSGVSRPSELLPCLHAAAVARRLERMGLAGWASGTWYARGRLYDNLLSARAVTWAR